MSNGFIVTLNNQTIYEFNETRHPARLRRHLEEIDEELNQGIKLGEQWFDKPDSFQKQQYVAMVLLNALDHNKTDLVSLMAAFLSVNFCKLKEIRATNNEDYFNFTLISK